MKAYIKQDGEYYEGDRESIHDLEVPQRPSYLFKWNGNVWIENVDKIKEEEVNVSKSNLNEIDTKSIRALRAIVLSLSKGETPSQDDLDILNEYELSVINERGKI